MFKLTYDILDDLEPRTADASRQVIEELPQTPEEFYDELFDGDYTHMFQVSIFRHNLFMPSMERCAEMLQYVRDIYFGPCDMDVQIVSFKCPISESFDLLKNVKEERIFVEERNVRKTAYFKIPVKMNPDIGLKRLVRNTLNFIVAVFSIMKTCELHPEEYEYIFCHRVVKEPLAEGVYSRKFKTFNVSVRHIYEQKFQKYSIDILKYRHNRLYWYTTILIELTKILEEIHGDIDVLEVSTYYKAWTDRYNTIEDTGDFFQPFVDAAKPEVMTGFQTSMQQIAKSTSSAIPVFKEIKDLMLTVTI